MTAALVFSRSASTVLAGAGLNMPACTAAAYVSDADTGVLAGWCQGKKFGTLTSGYHAFMARRHSRCRANGVLGRGVVTTLSHLRCWRLA